MANLLGLPTLPNAGLLAPIARPQIPTIRSVNPLLPPNPIAQPRFTLLERVQQGLGSLFGGQNDPNLSPEQNAAARKQAMLNAGLQMVLNSGPSTQPRGLAQILAGGALAGQQAGAQARQQAVGDQRMQAAAEAIARQVGLPVEAVLAHLEAGTLDNVLAQGHGAPAKAPTATVERGGVKVEGVAQEDALSVLNSLPEEQAEEMTAYQREQIRLAEERLSLDKMKATMDAQPGPADASALRKEYQSDPILKDSAGIAQSYQRILQSAQDPSAAGDLAIIFNFMKMLDPGSVVREGEFATAQNAAGVPDRIRAQYNRAVNGERFTPDVRADFVDRAKKLATGQQAMVRGVAERYSRFAAQEGIDPANVVYDPFEFNVQPQPTQLGDVLDKYLRR